ncbi:MAG: FimV/HubP family polar landmark protein [Methylobacter sp.]
MVTIVKKGKVRNLTKTLAVVSLLAPASGHTLGIGEIKLHSALNQNLNAEIALTLSGESVSDIKVNLAPSEKFDEAGVAWTYFLSKIKFETVTQSNGSAVIKLTSKEALKEPFLDFLLEVSWPKGSLYREFTVLVDPPSVYSPAPVPVSSRTENYVQPPVAAAPSQAHANGQSSEDEYGPTRANDTLWSVAERVRGQRDVSVEQMMIALYEANPHAFYKGNVYALTTGKMLKIPEIEAVLKSSRNQALAEFNRHTQAWKNHSAPSAQLDSAKEKPAVNQLTLIAPAKAAVADDAVIEPIGEQSSGKKKAADRSIASEAVAGKAGKVESAAVSADSVAIQSKIAELEKQLAMMQQLIALKDQQLAALQKQSQASPITQEQAPLEQVASAKSEAQSVPAPQAAESTSNEAAAIKPVVQVTPVPQPAVPAPTEVVAATPEAQFAPAPQPVEPIPSKPAAQVAPTPQPAKPAPNEVVPAKPVTQAPTAPQQTAVAKPVVQPVASNDTGLSDPYYLAVGGAGTLIASLIGWLWWRKRKVEEETNTESMFASSIMVKVSEADSSLSAPVAEDNIVNNVGTIGESSFLSEFTPSDFDSFDTDQGEIDPISEADVYLAYGRYQQAEELIRQAIKDQPNRDECKLKLLEVFYANENKEAFEAYANELAAAGKRNEPEFWEKAAEMGKDICPDSALFSFAAEPFAVPENIDENEGLDKESIAVEIASSEGGDNNGFVSEIMAPKDSGLDFDVNSSETEAEELDNADIDFDLSAFSLDQTESDQADENIVASNAVPDKQIENIDFDLSSFALDADESNKVEQGVAASTGLVDKPSGAQIEDIEFDLSAFSMDVQEPDELGGAVMAPNDLADNSLSGQIDDFDLSSFSTGTDNSNEVEERKSFSSLLEDNSPGVEIEDLDFDLSSFSMDAQGSDESEKDVAVLSDSAARSFGEQIETIDFDLSSFVVDSKESGVEDMAASNDSAKKSLGEQLETIDFDLSTFSMDFKESGEEEKDFIDPSILSGTPSETPPSARQQEFESYQFDMNPDAKEIGEIDFSSDKALDFSDDFGDDFDFNFDLDLPLTTSEQSDQYDEFGVSDLTDMDELETKLDLAKAYIDMGDAAAAKDIAKEVLEQGTVEQKKTAQALLDELD